MQLPALSYLLAHPQAASLTMRQPLWLLALLGVVVIFGMAARQQGYAKLALAMRCVAFTAVVLTLSGLAVRISLPSDRLSLIALVDRSDSIDNTARRWQEQYLGHLGSALAPDDELGVVAFARDAGVARPPGSNEPINLNPTLGTSGATDIAKALDTALALFPAERERRIVLLSDGNETRGDALSRLSRLVAANVSVFASVPPRASGADAAVDKIAAPLLVPEGGVFPIRVVVRNQGLPQRASVNLSVDGKSIGEESVHLHPGLNSLEIPYRLHEAGNHRIRAEVKLADDAVAGNNFRDANIMVGGKTRVLIVSPRSRSALGMVLERKGLHVTGITAAELAGRLASLSSFHCLIFEEIAAASLSARALDAIEQYVRNGGGFILAAGEKTYGDSGFKQTALAKLLPVTLEPRRPPRPEREPLALYLVIDRSNSMGYHVHNRMERNESHSKLEYAKRAALAVIGQLRDTDLVGVIVFDSHTFEVAPLRELERNRSVLELNLPRLVPGGGTDFYEALDMARRQLIEARTSLAHVMLLTDGDTNRAAADHYALIDAVVKAGITVTAIRIGDDTVNLQLLSDIAARTGGQFYHVENAELLPQLMLKDTSRALAHAPRHDEAFAVRQAMQSQILRGINAQALPALHGYAYAKPRAGADVLLQVAVRDQKDPLLAVWQYGLGRVAAFTAGFGQDAEAWVGWSGFGKLWSQIVHWTVREQTPWDFAIDVQRSEGSAHLVLHAFGDLGDATLVAQMVVNDQPVELSLVPRGPRTYLAPLPPLDGGEYPLNLLIRRDGELQQRVLRLSIPQHDQEAQEEYEASSSNRGLLETLTRATAGALDAPVRQIVGRQVGSRHVDQTLEWILLPLAMLCFLVDIAVRRRGAQSGD